MSKIIFLILSFSDFVAFVVRTDFSLKSEEKCHFFDKRGYPASVVQAGHHRAQQIDRQSALQTSPKENSRDLKQRRFWAADVNRKFMFLPLARFHAQPVSYKALILAFKTWLFELKG